MKKQNYSMELFFSKFWLKRNEFNELSPYEKKIVAQEYLKRTNDKHKPNSEILDTIVNSMVWVLNF